ncbi:hypothetical protein Pth03_74160 [Planotetraspora thailandica]|uniref:Uncharacterized protein n=2 Tax=Planotetraspora thailandica TaxID=487172 RepID=A0A8J4DFK7_9ACTN|nr:hypothetical protein Pth03_74160 [Planotetraspora thailandica]
MGSAFRFLAFRALSITTTIEEREARAWLLPAAVAVGRVGGPAAGHLRGCTPKARPAVGWVLTAVGPS